jgi:hypothetical protein
VATFKDGDPNGAMSQFTATINWGDGTTSPGRISLLPSRGFAVSGSHGYAEDGTYPVTIHIVDSGGATATAFATTRVGDQPDAFDQYIDVQQDGHA